MKNKNHKQIKMIVVTGLLVALTILLDRPPLSFSTNGWKIGFAFVPIVVSAVMYGPIMAGVTYGLADLIAANAFPTGPYFPGFTVCAVLMGVVYGLLLNKKHGFEPEKRVWAVVRIVLSVLINCAIGLFLNTLWVSMLYGKRTYWGWFVYRIPEYVILVPVSIVLIPVLIRLCRELEKI